MTPTRLERIIGFVLRTGVLVSTVGLGVGLVLSFLGTGPIALIVLDIGVIVLLATPVVRVVVSIVEYANERGRGAATPMFVAQGFLGRRSGTREGGSPAGVRGVRLQPDLRTCDRQPRDLARSSRERRVENAASGGT